jgi:probable phosphoglycerate mutase
MHSSKTDFEAVLMRHGQTEWSVAGRHTGSTDIPLTPEGEAEALAMAPHITGHEYELVLCSPLLRAQQTCELVGLAARAELREVLREWDYGDYEGLTSAQIRRERPDWNLWHDGCPGGESPEEVAARCDAVVAQLRTLAEGGGDAIVFAHGHILRALTARWCERPLELGARLQLATAAASCLAYEHDTPGIRFWNRTSQDR